MKNIALIFFLGLCLATTVVASQDSESTPHPLLEMLARVPDTAAVHEGGMVVYADMQAAQTARGLPPVDSAGAWAALSADDQQVWLIAVPGFTMIPGIASNLMTVAEDMPRLLGIDLFTIGRSVYFGQPPRMGYVLQGKFDSGAIGAALDARNYTSTVQGDVTVWCPPDGCDSGLNINPAAMEPGNPFGGDLGRQEPLAYAHGDVLESADYPTLNAIMDVASGAQPALAANPSYQAAASALEPDGLLRQAMFVETTSIFGADPASLVLGASASDQDLAALRQQYGLGEGHVPVGQAAELMVIGDIAQVADAQQIGRMALVFGDEAIAQAAATELDRRLAQDIPLLGGQEQTLQALIEARGGALQPVDLRHDDATGKWVLTLDATAPLVRGNARDANGQIIMSGSLARLWVNLVFQRDLLWLA